MRISSSTSNNPVRSMTGFAALRATTSEGDLTCTLRSVNHRGLDLHFHCSAEFAPFENEMRGLLKAHIARGHVDVRASLTRSATNGMPFVNQGVLKHYVALFRELSGELNLTGQPDLNHLLGLRGVIGESTGANELPEAYLGELLAALGTCVNNLNEQRSREGGQLSAEIAKQAAEIERCTDAIAAIRQAAIPVFTERLRERLRELIGSTTITEARLVEEAALLADRSDIHEEIVRLRVHTQELQKVLASGGEVGKRLDFLLQEMNREANTTLAKSAGAGEPGIQMTALGLTVKANIERIREQALNLE